jgi:glycosyltransferase involved in cell wall biosynthesis
LGPLLPDVGVLALVPDPWNSVWQVRHQVLTRLARYFRVVWVDPPKTWTDILGNASSESLPSFGIAPSSGFSVYEPESWLPQLYRPSWLASLSRKTRLKRARRSLLRQGCKTIILYVWRPEFLSSLSGLPFERTCYHIDDEYTFSDIDGPIEEAERQLIETVDQVFIGSPGLMAKKGTINTHTAFAPNGTDYAAFAANSPEPADIASIPHPRIGYIGIIKRHLDWSLLKRLPVAEPKWSFVFVGPVQEHPGTQAAVQELSRHPNVHFLGFKAPQQLAAYPQHFDVCLMPYRVDGYTKYIYPLKMHDYLASGRPVVTAPLRSVEEFGDVLTLVHQADGWPAAISEALAPSANTLERRRARQAVARQYDWNLLVGRMAKTMAARLAPEYLERLEAALEAESIAAGSGSPLRTP